MKNFHHAILKLVLCITISLFLFCGHCYSQNNIATGKIYNASNFFSGFPPENAFDESITTNWNAGGTSTQWISVDLLGTYDIYTIRLTVSQSPDGNTSHNIYKTTDNVNWTLVETISGVTSDQQIIILDYSSSPINTNGIRIETTDSPSWVAWSEIELFDAILPIKLINFEGIGEDDRISLSWSTASEINNLGFEIQKSNELGDWQIINTINGQGTSNEINDYEYIDENPYLGINYYRLKQIDIDGSADYSEVIAVEFKNSVVNINVFPNPSNNDVNIHINLPFKEDIKIKISDSAGREIWESKLIVDRLNWRKNFNFKSKGFYLATIQIGTKIYYEKIIISD